MADHPGDTIHATAIAVEGLAVLIRGPSGAGKSELALRCMMAGAWIGERHCRARLVADDRVSLRPCGLRLLASAPAPITGRLEVRGVGLVEVEAAGETPVAAVVDLIDASEVERLPEPATTIVGGVALPLLRLTAGEPSAHLKLLLWVHRGCDRV